MEISSGQVAVITGAGSGIGQALAQACAERGMHVLAADIEQSAAEQTASQVREFGVKALALAIDVSQADQIAAMAERCWQHFGACHLLCNNAGVSVNKPLGACTVDDWQWVISVNTLSVGYAVSAFIPRMRAQGCGHIVNTASMAGLIPLPQFGVYAASKYAVVGLSEVLAMELAEDDIGVSILCPGMVRTQIYNSERNRPGAVPGKPAPHIDQEDGMQTTFDGDYTRMLDPREVAAMVLEAVSANNLYVPTHPEWAPLFDQRVQSITQAFNDPLYAMSKPIR